MLAHRCTGLGALKYPHILSLKKSVMSLAYCGCYLRGVLSDSAMFDSAYSRYDEEVCALFFMVFSLLC